MLGTAGMLFGECSLEWSDFNPLVASINASSGVYVWPVFHKITITLDLSVARRHFSVVARHTISAMK